MADGNILSGTQQAPVGSDKAYHTDGVSDLFHSFAQLLTYIEDNIQITEAHITLADNITNDVSITKHGFVPKAPNDASKFLDGTGVFDTIKDSDLSTSDITTNNVSTTKHGFIPKLPNDATKYLDGSGAYSVPAGAPDSTKATKALDNLASVAINVPLAFSGDANVTIGSRSAGLIDLINNGTSKIEWWPGGGRFGITSDTTLMFGSTDSWSTASINVGISFISSGLIGIGNGGNGSFAGGLKTTNIINQFYKDINSVQILTTQQTAVADASGGAVQDAECRTALNSLLAKLRTHGLIAT